MCIPKMNFQMQHTHGVYGGRMMEGRDSEGGGVG